jgi:hypothetical protein
MLDLMAELQRNQLRPPTPSADKREGGKNSRKGKAEKTEAEEPVLIQEFALLTGTLRVLRISLDVQGVSKCLNGFEVIRRMPNFVKYCFFCFFFCFSGS